MENWFKRQQLLTCDPPGCNTATLFFGLSNGLDSSLVYLSAVKMLWVPCWGQSCNSGRSTYCLDWKILCWTVRLHTWPFLSQITSQKIQADLSPAGRLKGQDKHTMLIHPFLTTSLDLHVYHLYPICTWATYCFLDCNPNPTSQVSSCCHINLRNTRNKIFDGGNDQAEKKEKHWIVSFCEYKYWFVSMRNFSLLNQTLE